MNLYDDIAQLRTFVAIVDSGSLSAAARRLNSTQPTISRQLRALETRAGATLIQRDTHRMRLTHAGHQVLEDAKAILDLVDESEERLHDEQSQLKGHIRLFATIDFGQFVVSRMLGSFLEMHPDISIALSYSNRPVHMIEEGHDLGIVAGHITDDSIIAKPVGRIQRCVVASPAFLHGKQIRSPKDIEHLPWITLQGDQFNSSRSIHLVNEKTKREHTLSITPTLATEGVTSIREVVRMGLGVALLPTWLIKEDLVAKRLTILLPNWRPQDIPSQVIYPAQRRLPKRIERFIDYSAQYMSSILKTDLSNQ